MDRLPEGIALAGEPDHLPPLAALIVHVAGEHLGRWRDGLDLLARLADLPAFDPEEAAGKAVLRSRAILDLCAGEDAAFASDLERGHPGGDLPFESTRVRVLAVAAAALAGQGRLDEAAARFREAAELAGYGPARDDPAARALAITGNNLACELEERPGRTPAEDDLLELAAKTARRFWEIAGDWVNVKIAEYRLSMTYLALGRPADALAHAKTSLEICDANEAGPGDRFFCHEALARAHHASGDAGAAAAARDEAAVCLDGVREDMRDYARETLDRLNARLAG
jgi:hypothetical protein